MTEPHASLIDPFSYFETFVAGAVLTAALLCSLPALAVFLFPSYRAWAHRVSRQKILRTWIVLLVPISFLGTFSIQGIFLDSKILTPDGGVLWIDYFHPTWQVLLYIAASSVPGILAALVAPFFWPKRPWRAA